MSLQQAAHPRTNTRVGHLFPHRPLPRTDARVGRLSPPSTASSALAIIPAGILRLGYHLLFIIARALTL